MQPSTTSPDRPNPTKPKKPPFISFFCLQKHNFTTPLPDPYSSFPPDPCSIGSVIFSICAPMSVHIYHFDNESFFMTIPYLWISLLLNAVLLWWALSTILFSSIPVLHHSDPQHIDAASWYEAHPVDLLNASAVFNTVHGALKQKDSNLMPVGVSFIPAYIPPNTLMYHSTSQPEIPETYEWIAMDWEFSYSFAGFQRGKKLHFGPPHKKPHASKLPGKFGKPRGDSYLYTFRNTKPLDKIIYLEGASAAKTATGEMDQQLVLSGQDSFDGIVDEYTAADVICKWGKDFGLQGYIRLEVGFEMVLCDFHDGIELAANVSLANVTDLAHLPNEKEEAETPLEKKREKLVDSWAHMNSWEWARAGARVNDGESRILLDYSKMVTPHNKTWMDPDPYLRRLLTLSKNEKENIVSDVRKSMLEPAEPHKKTDWQLVTQRLEEKFAPLLMMLEAAFRRFENELDKGDLGEPLENAVGDLSRITYNIVRRYAARDIRDDSAQRDDAFKKAVEDYASHTYPLTTSMESLIYSSIYKITHELMTHIFDIYYTSREMFHDIYVEPSSDHHDEFKKTLLMKRKALSEFTGVLRWSIFTRCNEACAWDEICYSPTWGPGPFGWGANDKYMYHDGDRYRIPKELSCVSWKDVSRR